MAVLKAPTIQGTRGGEYLLGYADEPERGAVTEREADRLTNHKYVASLSTDGLTWEHMYAPDSEMESEPLIHVRSTADWKPDHYDEMTGDREALERDVQPGPADNYTGVERELHAFEQETRSHYRHELEGAYRKYTREEAIERFPVLAPMYDVMDAAAQFGQQHLAETPNRLGAFLERAEERALDDLADGKQLPSFDEREEKEERRDRLREEPKPLAIEETHKQTIAHSLAEQFASQLNDGGYFETAGGKEFNELAERMGAKITRYSLVLDRGEGLQDDLMSEFAGDPVHYTFADRSVIVVVCDGQDSDSNPWYSWKIEQPVKHASMQQKIMPQKQESRETLLEELKSLPIEETHKQAIGNSLASHGVASLSQLASHDADPVATVNMANQSSLPPAMQQTYLDLTDYIGESFNDHQVPTHALYSVAIKAHVLRSEQVAERAPRVQPERECAPRRESVLDLER